MRIYEFAQKKDISSKELIEKLQEGGFNVKSHMSVLGEDELAFLHQELFSPEEEEEFKQVKQRAEKKVPKPSEKEEERELESLEKPKKLKKQEIVNPSPEKKEEEKTQAIILESMSVDILAEKVKKPVTDVIVVLLKWGIVATKNQVVAEDIVKRLAEYYEIPIAQPEEPKKEVVKKEKELVSLEELKDRLPIVVVVGHVDHGKTTLLDYIRKTRVALKEKGGITQHLGAYEASTDQGNIVFLDTPGHEAFSKIRQRGVKVADLVILVVAADDGVMPQTVEAIKHAQAMNVPIIVAINKIDKVEPSRIEVVKRQLSQHGVMPEEWGGETVCIPISAKEGTGIDELLEMLVLQAQMMELRASTTGSAKGFVLESHIEKGRGPVATVICQHGSLRVGDYFVCGKTTGRISSLIDSYGKRLKEVLPSIPVQVAGFDELPEAGDFFETISKEEYRKAKSAGVGRRSLVGKRLMHEGGINLIVKADTHSSLEAVVEGIDKLTKKLENGFNILHQEVGDVSEGDVEFAYNTGAQVIGFNVKTEANALELAHRRKISIEHYGIIYKLLEALRVKAEEAKEVEMVRTKIGEAVVLRVFDIKKIGVIAGCIVKDGRFVRDGYAVILRNSTKIGEGKITSLQREKRTVKEVHTGFECGFIVEGFTDFQVDDRVECYIDMPRK